MKSNKFYEQSGCFFYSNGFSNRSDFYKARQLDIHSLREYEEYLNKRYKTYFKKISGIDGDAEKAYKDRRYSDFIRLKNLSTEKLVEVLYYKIFEEEISQDKDLNVSKIVSAIETKLNVNFGINDELNEWRMKRNKIVHDHLSIEFNEAEGAKKFFDDCNKKLRTEFDSY